LVLGENTGNPPTAKDKGKRVVALFLNHKKGDLVYIYRTCTDRGKAITTSRL